MVWIRSDSLRKELAGLTSSTSNVEMTSINNGIYSPESTEVLYSTLLKRALLEMQKGRRVIVDATFRQARHRSLFLNSARDEGLLGIFMECLCDRDIVRKRMNERLVKQNEGISHSDATWEIFEAMEKMWEDGPTYDREDRYIKVRTDGNESEMFKFVIDQLTARISIPLSMRKSRQ